MLRLDFALNYKCRLISNKCYLLWNMPTFESIHCSTVVSFHLNLYLRDMYNKMRISYFLFEAALKHDIKLYPYICKMSLFHRKFWMIYFGMSLPSLQSLLGRRKIPYTASATFSNIFENSFLILASKFGLFLVTCPCSASKEVQ